MRVAVLGAGSIGCYIGGRLQAHGHQVTFIGRAPTVHALRSHGLTLSDTIGWKYTLTPNQVAVTTDHMTARGADVVLVTTKSAGTQGAADILTDVLDRRTTVLSLQNGVRNVAVLQSRLQGHDVVAGMVPFNVARVDAGSFHQGSRGRVVIASGHPAITTMLSRAGLRAASHSNMHAVQWGKLIMNLNNAINGISGIPLKEQLEDRSYRLVLACAQTEALDAARAAGQHVVSPIRIPLRWFPAALKTPDPVFRHATSHVLAIDPLARSSLLDDLIAGRATEVDHINGEIVTLADRAGIQAPINAGLLQIVHTIENNSGLTMSGPELVRAVLNG
ncbi:2-dehydropantoate 2-reductase [Gordonia lacunae]|uniref:2-dehydropantoate 2-reductase n=1 Tax=Gordonia lacunae TaxID=417102 RepID=UPI0039E468F6